MILVRGGVCMSLGERCIHSRSSSKSLLKLKRMRYFLIKLKRMRYFDEHLTTTQGVDNAVMVICI